jgi:eukaryotic translation initiation factor 2C
VKAIESMSLQESFPRRPGHGTQGDPITVFANSFELIAEKNLAFYRYHVDVNQEGSTPKPSKLKTKRLFALLLEKPDYRGVVTDFASVLLSRKKLKNVPDSVPITYRAHGEDEAPTKSAIYTFTVQETGTILVSELIDWLKSLRVDIPASGSRNEVIQALNIIFGHYPQLHSAVATIGRDKKHYSINRQSNNFKDLGEGIEALRGFYKSVRPATGRLLLNVNVTHTVCFKPLRLDQLLWEFGLRNLPDLAKKLKTLRLQRLHLAPKKNNKGELIPNVVSFWDFATNNDGFGDSNRPQVSSYAAGPKAVKFFLNDMSAGSATMQSPKAARKGGKVPENSSATGRYISVWDYFRQSKLLVLAISYGIL